MAQNVQDAKPLVLMLGAYTDGKLAISGLQDVATLVFHGTDCSKIPDEEIEQAVAIIPGHVPKIDATVLDRCKRLRVITRAGIGFDNVDANYAAELGICVCNVPNYCIEEVANTALAHILSLFRQTAFLYEGLRRGDPLATCEELVSTARGCRRIRGSTLGLVGLGNVGIAVAERAKAFGFKVIFYDPYIRPGLDKAIGGVEHVYSLEELVQKSDCVSLNCLLTSDTKHMINESLLKQFKKGAFLVNVSRGALVDEEALAKALKEGWIAGAAVDVYEKEPFAFKGSVFEGVPNLICTPHSAWYSPEAEEECWSVIVEGVRYALQGGDPMGLKYCVNRDRLTMESCGTRWN